jgi:hypothetical protein
MKYIEKESLKYLLLLPLFLGLYFLFVGRDINLYYYYSILDNKEKMSDLPKVKNTKVDATILRTCRGGGKGFSSEDCFKDFYEKYTIKNGPEAAFSHLTAMISEDETLVPGCHYIAHGIGAGAYYYFNKDITEAFNFDVSKFFSNVGSCGNGYYHGVSIGLTEKIKSDDELYKTLKDFCKDVKHQGKMGEESCQHGIGHAVTLYYDHNLEKSTKMCGRLFEGNDEGRFGCMTGVRMQYGMNSDLLGSWNQKGVVGIDEFCKMYPLGSDDREACVVEGSGVVRYGEDYLRATEDCQTLPTIQDRKACTKLTVIHSIRLGRSEQAKKLCLIPKTRGERIECTVWFAKYLALSVDANHGKLYRQTYNDVCHTLNLLDYTKCLALVYENVNTFRSNKYYGEFLNLQDIKVLLTHKDKSYYQCKDCGTYIPAMVIN